MEKMLAYCGLVCNDCPAYVATQNNDMEALAALAVEWGGGEGVFTPEDMQCDGCLADGRIFKWCNECTMRNCASERGVTTCAHCADYGCAKLQQVFGMGGMGAETKKRLDALRESLQ